MESALASLLVGGRPSTTTELSGLVTRSKLAAMLTDGSKAPEGPIKTAPPPPVMPPALPVPPVLAVLVTPAPIAPAFSSLGYNAPVNPRTAWPDLLRQTS